MPLLPDGFDVDALLAPIPGDLPCGADLRLDYSPTSIYFRLRDARAEARDAEKQADETPGDESAPTFWRAVQSLAAKALAENAKDLEVATWLIEALVRTAGLPGLSAGAIVITGLIERYWDDVYPTPDEDGIETRVRPLAGLSGQGYDGTLMQPLRKSALFNRMDSSPFGVWRYLASLELSGISDNARRAQRIEAGVVPFDVLEREARAAGVRHWAAKRAEISGALESWTAMGAALDSRAGSDSPSTNRVRDLLQMMLEVCNRFAPAEETPAADEPDAAGAGAGPADGQAGTGGTPAGAPGVIATRDQALRQLDAIAAWFKRSEPNSPIAYVLDEAARRGRMSWPDLMAELISDETTRHALLSSLGIKPPSPPE